MQARNSKSTSEGNMVGIIISLTNASPLLEVSLDAVPEECVVKEMTDGLVELDWFTVIGVKPGTRSMGTSSQLQVGTDKQNQQDKLHEIACVYCMLCGC